MERLRQKRPRLALSTGDYDDLKGKVLRRDGWRCQVCGITINLEVHHIQPRSDLGSDVVDNLITLCAGCHRQQHNIS
jgi:5-methylcytosine-specific restriction endonuclease McrA